MKVAINKCYGGFGLSDKALEELIRLGMTVTQYGKDGNCIDKNADMVESDDGIFGKYYLLEKDDKEIRTDKRIIQVVEALGKEASGSCADIEIVEIPDDTEWEIEEYDGMEWIAEEHRTWS